jgi:hypothetical protein
LGRSLATSYRSRGKRLSPSGEILFMVRTRNIGYLRALASNRLRKSIRAATPSTGMAL